MHKRYTLHIAYSIHILWLFTLDFFLSTSEAKIKNGLLSLKPSSWVMRELFPVHTCRRQNFSSATCQSKHAERAHARGGAWLTYVTLAVIGRPLNNNLYSPNTW